MGGECLFALVIVLLFFSTTPWVFLKFGKVIMEFTISVNDTLIEFHLNETSVNDMHLQEQNFVEFILSRTVLSTTKFLLVAMCTIYMGYTSQMQVSRIRCRLQQRNLNGIRRSPQTVADSDVDLESSHGMVVASDDDVDEMRRPTPTRSGCWSGCLRCLLRCLPALFRCVPALFMTLVFSFSMAFKYALANDPRYMEEYLDMNANNSSNSSVAAHWRHLVQTNLASEPSYMTGYLPNMNANNSLVPHSSFASSHNSSAPHSSLVSTSLPHSWNLFHEFPPIFWTVFAGMVCTMGAMRCAIECLKKAVMAQMKALQPREILLAEEGEVKGIQLWNLLEVVNTVYASRDCIPAECLSLIVGIFLIVGFVEGGVVLAWVLHDCSFMAETFTKLTFARVLHSHQNFFWQHSAQWFPLHSSSSRRRMHWWHSMKRLRNARAN